MTQQQETQKNTANEGQGFQFTEGERYINFSLGEEEFAIPLMTVREVIACPEFTPVPHTPSYFLGITNLRGQIVSAIDLRQKLGIKPAAQGEPAIIICDIGTISLGVLVDSVNSVLTPKAADISPKPRIESKVSTDYILGVYRRDQHLVLFLDIARALNAADWGAISTVKNKAA